MKDVENKTTRAVSFQHVWNIPACFPDKIIIKSKFQRLTIDSHFLKIESHILWGWGGGECPFQIMFVHVSYFPKPTNIAGKQFQASKGPGGDRLRTVTCSKIREGEVSQAFAVSRA